MSKPEEPLADWERDLLERTPRREGTRSAEVIRVIRTVSLIGSGVEDDPFRERTDYWSLDGELLAIVDPEPYV